MSYSKIPLWNISFLHFFLFLCGHGSEIYFYFSFIINWDKLVFSEYHYDSVYSPRFPFDFALQLGKLNDISFYDGKVQLNLSKQPFKFPFWIARER